MNTELNPQNIPLPPSRPASLRTLSASSIKSVDSMTSTEEQAYIDQLVGSSASSVCGDDTQGAPAATPAKPSSNKATFAAATKAMTSMMASIKGVLDGAYTGFGHAVGAMYATIKNAMTGLFVKAPAIDDKPAARAQ